MYLIGEKIIITTLIASLLLMSCSHTATILKPDDSAKYSKWFYYYDDQFKAFGDKVKPPDNNSSKNKILAYTKAKDSWEGQQTFGTIAGAVLLVAIVVTLVIDLDKVSE